MRSLLLERTAAMVQQGGGGETYHGGRCVRESQCLGQKDQNYRTATQKN